MISSLVYGCSAAILTLQTKGILRRCSDKLEIMAVQQTVVAVYYISRRWLPGHQGERSLTLEDLRQALPVTLAFLCMQFAQVLCLANASMGSYVVAKGSCLSFNIILSRLFIKGFRITPLGLAGSVVVTFGVLLPLYGAAGSCTRSGWSAGLVSSLAQAVFTLLSSLATRTYFKKNPVKLLGSYTISSAILLWSWIVLFSSRSSGDRLWYTHEIMPEIIGSGLTNIVVAVSAIQTLKSTDPVSVSIIGFAKSILQILLAATLMRDYPSRIEIVGVGFVLIGSILYAREKFSISHSDKG